MKGFFGILFLFIAVSTTGCANFGAIGPQKDKVFQIDSPKTVSIIVPNDKNVDGKVFTKLAFSEPIWGRKYYNGSVAKQELIRVRNKSTSSFEIDRRVDNGVSGSGIRYTVNYTLKNDAKNSILELIPSKYTTYHEGLFLSFPVPQFSEEDLIQFLTNYQYLGCNIEVNSQYNTESIFSNFKRLANEEPYSHGDKDPVTGKIFKNRFSIPYKDQKILFSLETYPYRNGSKTVIYVNIPGIYTSPNVVDYNMIIDEIKSQLENIVNA